MFQNIARIEVAVERNSGKILWNIKRFIMLGFFFWVVLPVVMIIMLMFMMVLLFIALA